MSWGERIARLREKQGMTQGELAALVGITRASLSHYETNRRQPDFTTIKAIADIFQVPIDFLVGRTSTPDWTDPANAEVGRFLDRLELSDDDLLDQFDVTVDGKKLTQEETKRFIAFVRAERAMRRHSS